MLETLLIAFREGLEALLVVAIATLYLRRTARKHLISAVRSGLFISVLASAALGYALARLGEMSPLTQGVMALFAAAAVMWCVTHMAKSGKNMSHELTARLDRASVLDGSKGWLAVFGFTLLMVGREGIETATMMATLAANAEISHMAWGGALGVGLAAAIAWAWTRYGKAVDLGRFFRVTSWFLMVFAVQLLVYALHEFTDANLVPGIDNSWWHAHTEGIAEGAIAQGISITLVLVPTIWLAAAQWQDRRRLRT